MKDFIKVFGGKELKKDVGIEADFSEFIDLELFPEGGLKAPLFVMWELTSACPNECVYCYNSSHLKRRNELTSEEKFKVANAIIDSGVFQVCLTGGEPLMCPEYLDILRYLRTRGVAVGTIFSGAGLTDDIVRSVSEYVDMVQISLDGSSKETHDFVRNRKGSFDEAINAIKKFVDNNVQVRVSFASTSYNIDDFEKTYQLCEELGASSIRTQKLSISGRAKSSEQSLYPTEEQLEKLEKFIYAQKKLDGMPIEYKSATEHILFGIRNGFANTMRITPEGNVGITPYTDVFFGNLQKESFQKIWDKMKKGWHNKEVIEISKELLKGKEGTLSDPLNGTKIIK